MKRIDKFVDSLDILELEYMIRKMVKDDMLAVHIESKSTTYVIDDVYDNSSKYQKLTILYINDKE